jgi:fructokinase
MGIPPQPPAGLAPPLAGLPPQVVCFGEALLDRLLPLGVEPGGGDGNIGSADACDDRLGGAPANVACGLARLGTPAAFAGRLGTDSIGAAFQALFAGRGVNTSALQWDPLRPSRTVLVQRDRAGERSFGGFLGDRGAGFADQALDATALATAAAPLLAGARWLLSGTLPLASPASAAALTALLELLPVATSGPIDLDRPALAVDVNWRPRFWGLAPGSAPPASIVARIWPLLERARLLKCAAEEARWLFASQDPLAISAALPGRPAVCITDGAAPLLWCLGGRCGWLEPLAIEVVDSTGAGDAFMAGLLHQLCAQPQLLRPEPLLGDAQQRLEAALRFAAGCGALTCTAAGAIDPQPDAGQVARFLQQPVNCNQSAATRQLQRDN